MPTLGVLGQTIRYCQTCDATTDNDEIVRCLVRYIAWFDEGCETSELRGGTNGNGQSEAERNWQHHFWAELGVEAAFRSVVSDEICVVS
jgi:hypothetical protein